MRTVMVIGFLWVSVFSFSQDQAYDSVLLEIQNTLTDQQKEITSLKKSLNRLEYTDKILIDSLNNEIREINETQNIFIRQLDSLREEDDRLEIKSRNNETMIVTTFSRLEKAGINLFVIILIILIILFSLMLFRNYALERKAMKGIDVNREISDRKIKKLKQRIKKLISPKSKKKRKDKKKS